MNHCKLKYFRQPRSKHNNSIKFQYIIPLNLQFNTGKRSFLEIILAKTKSYHFFTNLVEILITTVSSHLGVKDLKTSVSIVYSVKWATAEIG